MKSTRLLCVVAAAVLLGCGRSGQTVGTMTSIIVITTDSLWAAVGDSVLTALEPRIFTVRDERTFEVTQVSPQDPTWQEARQFRQLLVIGTAEDGWVEPVLRRAGSRGAAGPDVVHTRDVWGMNQYATAMVVPPGGGANDVLAQVPRASHLIDSVFRGYARNRMYTSGQNSALRDSLRQSAGFGIILPNVYQRLQREGNVELFQNSTTLGGDLVRSVLVTWRDGLVQPGADAIIAWRDSVARTEYRPAQETVRDNVQTQALQLGDVPAIEMQGNWEGTDPSWPAGGPFITRMLHCPQQNRTVLIDTWLYAPGRTKYEYMIQLQTILNTFECA